MASFGYQPVVCERCQRRMNVYPKTKQSFTQRICGCGGPLVPVKAKPIDPPEAAPPARFCETCRARLRRGNATTRCAVCQQRGQLQSIHV